MGLSSPVSEGRNLLNLIPFRLFQFLGPGSDSFAWLDTVAILSLDRAWKLVSSPGLLGLEGI